MSSPVSSAPQGPASGPRSSVQGPVSSPASSVQRLVSTLRSSIHRSTNARVRVTVPVWHREGIWREPSPHGAIPEQVMSPDPPSSPPVPVAEERHQARTPRQVMSLSSKPPRIEDPEFTFYRSSKRRSSSTRRRTQLQRRLSPGAPTWSPSGTPRRSVPLVEKLGHFETTTRKRISLHTLSPISLRDFTSPPKSTPR